MWPFTNRRTKMPPSECDPLWFRPRLETLEGRCVPADFGAALPLGAPWSAEYEVGPVISVTEPTPIQTHAWAGWVGPSPMVAMSEAGDFVVVWKTMDKGAGIDLYGQRFAASGVPLGSAFQINATHDAWLTRPVIAMNAEGRFVVAWMQVSTPTGTTVVYARSYDADGQQMGRPVQVSSAFNQLMQNPKVAIDRTGNFVVAWETGTFGTEDWNSNLFEKDIFARRFDASALPLGGEFRVNDEFNEVDDEYDPAIAMGDTGELIVSWTRRSRLEGSYDSDIFAQRFSAVGERVGENFRANPTTAGNQFNSHVAMNCEGDFAIVWSEESRERTWQQGAIFRASDNTAGMARSEDVVVVNILGYSEINAEAVFAGPNGHFLIVWSTYQWLGPRNRANMGPNGEYSRLPVAMPSQNNSWSQYALWINPAGAAQGSPFVLDRVSYDQSMAMNTHGDMVFAWTDWNRTSPESMETSVLVRQRVAQQSSRISGSVTYDFGRDGKADVFDDFVEGCSVYLEKLENGRSIETIVTITDTAGRFEFRDLEAGMYRVYLQLPEYWIATNNPDGVEILFESAESPSPIGFSVTWEAPAVDPVPPIEDPESPIGDPVGPNPPFVIVFPWVPIDYDHILRLPVVALPVVFPNSEEPGRPESRIEEKITGADFVKPPTDISHTTSDSGEVGLDSVIDDAEFGGVIGQLRGDETESADEPVGELPSFEENRLFDNRDSATLHRFTWDDRILEIALSHRPRRQGSGAFAAAFDMELLAQAILEMDLEAQQESATAACE